MGKKYELVKAEELISNGKCLYKIRALTNFGRVRAGDLGGYIESEKNLSHNGTCWVYDNAWVTDNAKVTGHAEIRNSAGVGGNSIIKGHARITDRARVFNSIVQGLAVITGDVIISSDQQPYIKITGNASVSGCAQIFGHDISIDNDSEVCAYSYIHTRNNNRITITDEACITGNSIIYGGTICEQAVIDGGIVEDSAKVGGRAKLMKGVTACKNAVVTFGEYSRKGTILDTSITTMKFKKCIDIWISSGDSIKVGINEDNDLIICLGNDPYIPIHAISEVYTGHNAKILQTAVELAKLDLYKKED